MNNVVVTGGYDDLKSRHVRFLEEASKFGNVHVLLWADEAVRAETHDFALRIAAQLPHCFVVD